MKRGRAVDHDPAPASGLRRLGRASAAGRAERVRFAGSQLVGQPAAGFLGLDRSARTAASAARGDVRPSSVDSPRRLGCGGRAALRDAPPARAARSRPHAAVSVVRVHRPGSPLLARAELAPAAAGSARSAARHCPLVIPNAEPASNRRGRTPAVSARVPARGRGRAILAAVTAQARSARASEAVKPIVTITLNPAIDAPRDRARSGHHRTGSRTMPTIGTDPGRRPQSTLAPRQSRRARRTSAPRSTCGRRDRDVLASG